MVFITIVLVILCTSLIDCTPLDDYVNKFDPNYHFEVLDWTYKGDGFTMYSLNMTSQKWLTGKWKSNLKVL